MSRGVQPASRSPAQRSGIACCAAVTSLLMNARRHPSQAQPGPKCLARRRRLREHRVGHGLSGTTGAGNAIVTEHGHMTRPRPDTSGVDSAPASGFAKVAATAVLVLVSTSMKVPNASTGRSVSHRVACHRMGLKACGLAAGRRLQHPRFASSCVEPVCSVRRDTQPAGHYDTPPPTTRSWTKPRRPECCWKRWHNTESDLSVTLGARGGHACDRQQTSRHSRPCAR